KGKAETQGMQLPVYANQKSAVESKQWRRVGIIAVLVCLLLLSGASFWIWYKYSGSLPKVVFAFRFQDPAYFGHSRFLSGNDLVMLHSGRLSRHDLKNKKEIWSQPLIDLKKIADEAQRLFDKQEAAGAGRPLAAGTDYEAFRPPTLPELKEGLEA